MEIAHLAFQHPGGVDRGHPGGDVPALMAADVVEGQGGTGLLHGPDLAVGRQAQLDQGLEAVADAQHQAVAVFEQVVDSVGKPGVAEEGADELGRAVGLVAAGEAAGQHHELGRPDGGLQRLGRLGQQVARQVAHHHDLRLHARPQTGLGGVVLAVGTRKHGDHRLGPGRLGLAHRRGALVPGDGLHRPLGPGPGGVDLLQHPLVQGQQRVDGGGVAADGDDGLGHGGADPRALGAVRLSLHLGHNDAGHGDVPYGRLCGVLGGKTYAVAKGHLHHSLRQAVLHRPGGLDAAMAAQLVEIRPGCLAGVRLTGAEDVDPVSRLFKLGGKDFAGLDGSDGKGDEGGGHIQVQEGPGHGVLTADGGGPQLQLGVQGPQQGGEGLAPPRRLVPQLFKEFLEGEIGFSVVGARGHQLGHRGIDRAVSPGVGVGAHLVRVKGPGHHAGLLGLPARLHGEEGGHGLGGGPLTSAAEGHQHAARADGAVKPLGQAPAGSALQTSGQLPQAPAAVPRPGGGVRLRHGHLGVLHRAVGAQEGPGQVGHHLPPPAHHHPGVLSDHRHRIGLQVLRLGGGDEAVGIGRGHHHRHALLGLGNGQLGAVQAVVFLAHGVQVDGQAVGQLADGHGHAARAEVVAPLDEAGHVAPAEQPLDLPLLGGVALLHLGGHGVQALPVMALGGAGGSPDAVPAGAAAQKDDHVAGGGLLPHHVVGGSGPHHGAALQALGHIAGVVDFGHMAGGQANLVAVGGVARGGGLGDLALGQLALQRLVHGDPGVAAAGDAHGLVDVHPAGQGVPDAAADAGGRAAEGLNLGGMVVGLVLEHQQPVLLLAVHHGGDVDGAGIDLLAFVQLGEQAPLFQGLGADGGQVHQGLGPPGGLLGAVDLHPGGQIPLIGGPDGGGFDLHPVQVGGEGGVAAVVGPVGIHQPQLGDGGVPALFVPHIVLKKFQIVSVHGQAVFLHKGGNFLAVQRIKALQRLDGFGRIVLLAQRLLFGQVGLAALHGVDEMAADAVQLLGRGRAGEEIHARRAHGGPLALTDQLDALLAARRARVELPRQVFNGDHRVRALGQTVVGHVHGRLGKDHRHAAIKQRLLDALHVVAVEHAHARHALDEQNVPDLLQKALRLHGVFGRFFHIYAVNCHVHSPLCVIRAP